MAPTPDSPDPAGAGTMSRRALLRRTGAGLATIAVMGTGAVGFRAYDQGVLSAGEGPAYSPWETWREGGGLLRLVRAAVLAPSPHNAQAWLFALRGDGIDVHVDRGRSTGPTDPFDREMHIGVGAAIENLALAARADGLAPTIDLLADGGSHVARVALRPAPPRVSPLYAQIPHRHTNRYPYLVDRAIPEDALTALSALALPDVKLLWITDVAGRHRFGEHVIEATEAIVADHDQRATDHRWFRQSWDDIQERRDGITLDAAGLPALTTTIAKILPAQSPAALGESWLDSVRTRHTRTAAAYGIVLVRDATDIGQRLRGGRTLQRVHLWATGAGIAVHHMNQLTERADRERQLGIDTRFGDVLAQTVPSGWEALCAFRLGYSTHRPKASPRRSVHEVIIR